MKILRKIIFILFMIVMLSCSFQYVYSVEDVSETGIKVSTLGLGDLDAYKPTGTTSDSLDSKAEKILGVVRTIGIVASVTVLTGIGIKYMLASVEQKADYKKSMIPYIVGAAIVFLGSFVPQLIYDIVEEIGWI